MLKNMRYRQQGFAHLSLILLLMVALVIGAVGWYVYDRQSPEPERGAVNISELYTPTPMATPTEVAWVTYTDPLARLTFQHPQDWSHKIQESTNNDTEEFPGARGILTSPLGNSMIWNFSPHGGKGGMCEPGPNDRPFADNNNCASIEVLSVEKAQTIKDPQITNFRMPYQDTTYITHTHYKDERSETYNICLMPYWTGESENISPTIPKPHTYMGFLLGGCSGGAGFYVGYTVKTEAELTSDEAKTAEKIMKSFNSL